MLIGDVSFVEMETGVTQHIDMSQAVMQTQCLNCGRPVQPVNMHAVENDGRWMVGFADTPEQLAAIRRALDELRELDDAASLDEILGVLEAQGPEVRPIVDYLRRHHLELANLGVGLLAIVVQLLFTLLAPAGEAPPQPPDGITHEQMERLLQDLEQESAPAHQDGRPRHGDARHEQERAERRDRD